MTATHDYPPPRPEAELPAPTVDELLSGVPWFRIQVPTDIYDRIWIISRREAQRRDRAKAKARKHRNPRWRRRHNRRQAVIMTAIVGLILVAFMKAPEDPFHKHPAPPSGPAIVQPTTVTTGTGG
jgi:hypothetical protein